LSYRQVPEPVDDDKRFPRAPNGCKWWEIKKARDILRDQCEVEFLLAYKNIPGAAMLLLATLPSECILEVSHQERVVSRIITGSHPSINKTSWMEE
jgi:hypothetical protein